MSKTRMGKRVASLLLSLVMMLSLLPTTVYATGDTGETTDEIVGQATTSGDNTEGTGEPEPTGEGEDGSANVTEGEDGAATNDAVVEETIAPVNAEGVDAVANAENSGDEISGEDGNKLVNFVTVNGATKYETLDAAIKEADPDANGVITYNISGKVSVTATGWVQVAKSGLDGLTKVAFVGEGTGAEICITGQLAILADQNYDINVSFENLTLSKLNPAYGGDYGHSTNYFTTWLRNTGAAENTVTYTDCTFPNGVCNNQYGKTVFDNCQFANGTTGLYNLWVYGGNVELNGGTFTGVRGAKVYTEGNTQAKTPMTVDIKGTSFEGLTEKAAIVVSKAAAVTLTNVSATDCNKGLFQKAIEGSSNEEEVVIAPSGTNVSGTFVVDGNKGVSEADKRNFNISAGTFKGEVSSDYLAEGLTIGEDGTVKKDETSTAVAKIGNTEYATLEAAIAAAQDGQTVTLLADANEDVAINKNITLNLGGKTLTNTNAGKATISVSGSAVVAVKNGSVMGGTKYYNIEVTKGSNANLTLEGVTATAGNTASSMIDNWGTLTIESGTYEGGLNVVKSEEGSTLTINGGKFTGTYAPDNSKYNGVILSAGTTTINNGEFIQSVTTPKWRYPQVVLVMQVTGYTSLVTVNGGTFTNKYDSSTAKIFHPGTGATSDNLAVKGGTFNKKVPDSYLADGYICTGSSKKGYSVSGPYEAKIGGTKYETLQAAFEAANTGDTVTLLTNCQSGRINLEDKSITVDLNGKTLTSTADYGVMFCAMNGNTITINGTTEGSKLVGTLMVTNGTHGRIVINGGTYENAKYCPIYINGAVSTDDSTLTVTDATIKALEGDSDQDNGVAVYLAGYSTSTFTNTTITAPVTGLEIRAGKLTLTNCTVTGGNGEVATSANGNGNTVTNAAVAISQHTTKKAIDVTINGGTYTATAAVYQTDVQGTGSEGVKANIKAGTFNGTVYAATNNTVAVSGGSFSSAVPENCCADGYIPAKNEGGTYGVKEGSYVAETNGVKYESLQAAIDKASKNATVKLLANTRENVTIDKALTLDLNGHILNGGTEKGKPALTITARTVTIKDSSEAQTGTIMREDTAENSGVSSHYVIDIQGNAWVMFESGNVKNGSGAGGTKGASLVRVGDDSVAKYPGLNIKGGTFTQDNFIVIKVDSGDLFLNGGTLSSKNSYAIENWHRATVKGGTVNGTVAAWTYRGGQNSDLSIEGGTINGNIESVSYDGAAGKKASVSITGGVVNGMLSTHIYNKETEPSKDIATIEVTGGTFSSDPTKYLVECSTVTPNADGTFGVAKAYLATVGETSYYTMDEAFKAQTTSGEPIVLLRDYTTGSPFHSGTVARTVDLNGHTWTCTGTDANSAAFEINYPNVTLTVKNGKVVSSQLVGLIPSAMGGTITYDNSSLTFENVEMSTTATSGIETNGNNANDAVTLKNSTLNVPNGFGIYFPSSGKLTIDNSTITAKTMGVQVCAGSLSINAGSAITVSGDAVPKTENDGAIQDGAAISIVNRAGYKGLGNVTVTGGTFKANGTNEAIKAYDWDNTESAFTANDKVFVSDGTFSSAVPEGLCKDGYISVANGDGTHTVKKGVYVAQVGSTKYESLAAAIGAAQDGDTVTLLKDIDLPATAVVKGKTITLDLNGKTISNSTDIWNESINAWSLISVRVNGDLTINDTAGGGTLKAKENDCYALDVQDKDTALTVNAGTYVGNISAIYAYDGKVTINGGHFSIQQKKDDGDPYRFTLNCYDSNYKADSAGFTVNGGTFENFDPRNNPAEGAGTSFVAESVGVDKNTDGTFTAKPNMAAQIIAADGSSVKAYDSLAAAIEAAQAGQTVMLLGNIDLDAQIATGKAITIDGQSKYTIKATKQLVGTNGKAGMFYRTTSAQGTLTFLNVTLDGNSVSKIFLNEGGAGKTVFDGVTSINGGGIAYGSGIHISGGGSHATIRNSTLTGSKGTMGLNEANYYAANDLWVGGNVYVTVENSTIGYVFVNSAPSATATNGVVHGQLTITGENTKITYLSGEEEAPEKVDKFGNNGSLVKIDSGSVDTIFDMGSYEISGGTFKTEIKPEWCAKGYVPANNGNGTYTVAEGEFTVQVTSRTVSSESPVAHVSGGGNITYAEGTIATTTTVAGYEFVGWYVDNYPDGKYLGKELTITYKPTADCTLVAVYKPISGGTFELKVDASKFKVNGGATNTSKFSAKLAANSLVTIKFTGDNFLYWVNGSGKVVSTLTEYTFTLVSATVLSAVYTNSEADEAQVIFLTANPGDPNSAPQIVSSRAYGKDTTTISFPAPPVRIGKSFTGWSMTQEQIIAAIPDANVERGGKILVYAMYEDQKRPCTVTVFYGDKQQEITATIGTRVELTAPQQADGKEFSCWKDSEGKVLGTTRNLYVTPVGDMTVYAVYGETVEQLPTISMLKPVASVANEKYVVTFSAVRSIPDGYTIEELGILYSMDRSYGNSDAKEYMVLGSDGEVPAGVYRARATQTTPLGTVRCNITTGSADRTFYARGYMILKDSEGNIAPYYSEIASGSYNSLTNGGN